MIEEEARVDRDRRLIAGVIYNRLKIGMALGIDATLLYDDPDAGRGAVAVRPRVRQPVQHPDQRRAAADTDREPGEKSLRAALDPADTEFLYYVLCGADGHHKFALTLAEHNRNVDACLG